MIFTITWLSMMPCKDDVLSGNKRIITLLVKPVPEHSNHPSQGNDMCSPFCQCSCCNSPTLTFVNHISISIPLYGKTAYAELSQPKVLSNYISIWQPPKLLS